MEILLGHLEHERPELVGGNFLYLLGLMMKCYDFMK
jgi:hypothetical protein